ncbi:MAG: ribosome biogenesis GTPase Der [Victivallales bacterium]|nr:ribosome biogenesis GTPase Der [Victivallales bacterium]
MIPTVVIVGRPNVGKSALFNCILKKRVSIVHEQSGVTRDRVVAVAQHGDKRFTIVDTGGLGLHNREKAKDIFDGMIREQVDAVVAEASLLLWVVNCQEGITPQDKEVGSFIHKTGKPVIVVANKADNPSLAEGVEGEFAALGYSEIYPTSCAHTSGVRSLLDAVLAKIPEELWQTEEEAAPKRLNIAVVGKPNVGKSSLVNRLIGQNRMMVSDIAGTTRDAVDIPVDLDDEGDPLPITLIDTAGMRRKKQVDSVVELFSLSRSENAIKRADLVILMLDGTDPCSLQERRIAHVVMEEKKACLLLVNKWDLARKDFKKPEDMVEHVRRSMPFMEHAPILMVSVKTGFNIKKIASHIMHVREQMNVTVPTGVLNQFLQDMMGRNPPKSKGLKVFKIFYGTMESCPPPKFLLFVNRRALCPANYLQYVENQLRDAFYPEAGLPIVLNLRERESHEQKADGKRQAAAGEKKQREIDYQAKRRRQARARGYRSK